MKKSGFTLIELMIVVAIIAIIAAIAIPNLLRSQMAANEASAIGSLRTIVTAETQFLASGTLLGGATGLVPQYGSLPALFAATPPFLDAVLGVAAPVKSGYSFAQGLTTGVAPGFSVTAIAGGANTGSRNFFVNNSGVITWLAFPGVPVSTDPPLQ